MGLILVQNKKYEKGVASLEYPSSECKRLPMPNTKKRGLYRPVLSYPLLLLLSIDSFISPNICQILITSNIFCINNYDKLSHSIFTNLFDKKYKQTRKLLYFHAKLGYYHGNP